MSDLGAMRRRNFAATPPTATAERCSPEREPAECAADKFGLTLPPAQADIDRIARALETANAARDPAKENQQAEETLQARKEIARWVRWLAYIAGFQAGVTLLGVVMLAFTLAAARRTATAARDATNR